MLSLVKLLFFFVCSPETTGKVVGQKDCKLNDVVKTLQQANTLSILGDKLPSLAIQLDLPQTDINDLIKKDLDGGIVVKLHKVLQIWLSNSSTEAYLNTLIEALRTLHLNDAADLLFKRFETQDVPDPEILNTPNSSNCTHYVHPSDCSTYAHEVNMSDYSSYDHEVSTSASELSVNSSPEIQKPSTDVPNPLNIVRMSLPACLLSQRFDANKATAEKLLDTSFADGLISNHNENAADAQPKVNSCQEVQDVVSCSANDNKNHHSNENAQNAHSEMHCHKVRSIVKTKTDVALVLSAIITFLFLVSSIIILAMESEGESHVANGDLINHTKSSLKTSNETTSVYNKVGSKKYLKSFKDVELETKNLLAKQINTYEITLENSTMFSVAFNAYTSNGFVSGNITFVNIYTFISMVEKNLINLRILANEPWDSFQLSTNLNNFPVLSLPLLETVFLQNLFHSDDIYSLITDKITADNLENFTSVVDDDRESLKDVDTCSSVFIDDKYPTASFCKRFPNVRYFASNVGKVSTNILHHTGCPRIKHVMMNLANCEPNVYSDTALGNRFQELERANITIYSLSCGLSILQYKGTRKINNVIFNVSIECSEFW